MTEKTAEVDFGALEQLMEYVGSDIENYGDSLPDGVEEAYDQVRNDMES